MLAGVFTTVIMAPGERIKCLLQVGFSLDVNTIYNKKMWMDEWTDRE